MSWDATVEVLFAAGLLINALLFIPQIIRLFQAKHANEVSMITFLGFFLIQLTVVLHGAIRNDLLLFWGNILSMVTCGTIVLQIIYYRYGARFIKKSQ